MNELIVKYKVAACHFIYIYSNHVMYIIALSSINYNIKFTVHNKLESYIHRSIDMNLLWILYQRKISMVIIGDMLYILQNFNLNFISFFIDNTVVFYNYSPTSPSRLLRKLWTTVKGNNWQIKMKYVLFLKIL